ncbi:phage tail tape measure protein [Caldibacillus thermoamylovorans]|uniref:phage tail tape measure protein n=1 Tax=Caldibacillus thermoamylovorans TaxID=35841 RepID=UPI0020419BE9|nr:phage tail tape measure protein [Caldibacillus thermoamylovorans]MCM3800039.1 phage tail tape measure protein [Caldibacillus thermoamylovorans]
MEEIGALRARLLLEADQFKKGMQQTREELQRTGNFAKSTNKNFDGLNKALRDIGLSSSQIDKINERIKKANPKLLEKDLSEVRKELGSLGLSSKEIDKITKEVEKASKSSNNLEKDLNRIQTAALALGAAVAGAVGASVKTAADFEAQMSRVKAISGATDEEFQALQDSAMKLGASTSKSASEVAVAFEDMAAKGFNANQIIAAMPGVIAAAEASGADLATTSDVVSSALNIFSLKASDASKVADILAQTANQSAADISDMQLALKYAGPPAAALGISLEELSASIGIMTNAGMRGEQAGTTLRAALLSLLDPSEENSKMMKKMGITITDAQGNFVGLSALVDNLSKSMEGQTETQKAATLASLVGTEAVSGMLSLMSAGPTEIDKMTKALENSGGASKKAADIMKNNLKGAYEEFKGALETVGIKLGNEFLPKLTEIVKKGSDVVGAISEMDTSTLKAGLAFGGTAAAIALTATTVGKLITAVRGLMISMGPAGWLIAGVSLLGGVIAGLSASTKDLETRVADLSKGFEDTTNLDKQITRYEELQGKSKLTSEQFGDLLDVHKRLQTETDTSKLDELNEKYETLKKESGLSGDEVSELLELNGDLIEQAPQAADAISEQGQAYFDNTGFIRDYNAEQLKTLQTQLEIERNASRSEYADKLKELKKVSEEINEAQDNLLSIQDQYSKKLDEIRIAEEEVNKRKADSNTYSQYDVRAAEANLTNLKNELRDLETKLQTQQGIKAEKEKEKAALEGELEDLEVIREQLAQLYLTQVGLTSEKGKELDAINEQIGKYEAQKEQAKLLHSQHKISTEEYQKQVGEIDTQIARLEEAKKQIEDLNTEMGKPIYKRFEIDEVTRRRVYLTEYKRNQMEVKHGGGIVGKPKFHTGGVIADALKASPIGDDSEKATLLVAATIQSVQLLRNKVINHDISFNSKY